MMKQVFRFLAAVAIVVTASLTGCSESKPSSVTKDADQSAIDAWKEKEKQIEAEAAAEMELGQ